MPICTYMTCAVRSDEFNHCRTKIQHLAQIDNHVVVIVHLIVN